MICLSMIYFLSLLLFISAPVWAEGKKPEKKPPEKSSSTLHDAKEGANDALNDIDKGVHKAIPAVKEGAEEALDAVDKGVHKVVGTDKKKP